MRILFVASECAPFAKAGGLGDVVGALPIALRRLGHDVRVVLPKYGFLSTRGFSRMFAPLGVPLGDGEAWCGVLESRLPDSDVPIYLLEHDVLHGGATIYTDDATLHGLARFGLLSRGALQLCRQVGFTPDVIHVHDWPTALLPVMLNTVERGGPFDATATVLTIHNLAHQPRFPAEGLDYLEIGAGEFRSDSLEDYGSINPLKGGLYHSTMLTTVSPTYAQEIRSLEGGQGLHAVMQFRAADLVGILNGIDEAIWDPENDALIPARYSADDLSGKAACKRYLQRLFHLDQRPDVPMFGSICRLTHQKGVDVVLEAMDRVLGLDTQVVMLGSGHPQLEAELRRRSHKGQGRFFAWVGYNEQMAHQIEAACDFFLMASRFEPCGLNQMYSQRYGTLPIVRATGGLADTVEDSDPRGGRGTGFSFDDLSVDNLVSTIERAVRAYHTTPAHFMKMQRRSMRKDLGWDAAATKYLDVYRWALERKRQRPKAV